MSACDEFGIHGITRQTQTEIRVCILSVKTTTPELNPQVVRKHYFPPFLNRKAISTIFLSISTLIMLVSYTFYASHILKPQKVEPHDYICSFLLTPEFLYC